MDWLKLKQHIKSKYDVADEDADRLRFVLPTVKGRTQILVLQLQTVEDRQWVEIISPIADHGTVDVLSALRQVGELVVGGLILVDDDVLSLRHSVPLENLDPNEIFEPFEVIRFWADVFEERFTSLDMY